MPRPRQLPPITWPTVPLRETSCRCSAMRPACACARSAKRAIAGENRAGEPGYVHIVDCATGAEGPGMSVEVGWSKDPNAKVDWRGGLVSGIIVARPPQPDAAGRGSAPPGLEPSAPPSRRRSEHLPDNHRGYAAEWFALRG